MKDYFSAWRAMEDAYKEGRLRAIGVSNFYPFVLTNFCETVEIEPMVNQIETHSYFTQEPALEVMNHYNVVPEAWAPLGGGRYNPFKNAEIFDFHLTDDEMAQIAALSKHEPFYKVTNESLQRLATAKCNFE